MIGGEQWEQTWTCGDLAKGACLYFQQDVDGAALQDHSYDRIRFGQMTYPCGPARLRSRSPSWKLELVTDLYVPSTTKIRWTRTRMQVFMRTQIVNRTRGNESESIQSQLRREGFDRSGSCTPFCVSLSLSIVHFR